MAKSFSITTANDGLKADVKGHAEAMFTVTNATGRPLRCMARANPMGNTKREWLSLAGESERDFAPGATQQYTVSFDSPGPPAKYQFRMDVASATNPDEDFTEGPVVSVDMAPAPVVEEKKKKMNPLLWIIPAAAVLLIIIGVVIWLLVRTKNSDVPNVVGKPVAEATSLLAAAKLKANVKDKKVTGTVAEGQVAEQSPESGSLAEGSTVDLIVEAKPAATPAPKRRVNVALDKNAKQSTTILNALPSRAVDGNTDGNWANNSVTHTDQTAAPWWQVDLGQVYEIANIKVWNRTDCCPERLSNFYLFVSDKPFASNDLNTTINQPGVSAFPAPGLAGTPSIFTVGKPGRFVRIQLVGANFLSLAEVEVMADETATDEAPGPLRPRIPGRLGGK